MRRVAVLVLALPVWLSACASANKRYEQGQRAEREGRAADAAARYVQALKKDGSLESARTGLRDAGARAVADYVAQAAAEDAAGRPDRAADVVDRDAHEPRGADVVALYERGVDAVPGGAPDHLVAEVVASHAAHEGDGEPGGAEMAGDVERRPAEEQPRGERVPHHLADAENLRGWHRGVTCSAHDGRARPPPFRDPA